MFLQTELLAMRVSTGAFSGNYSAQESMRGENVCRTNVEWWASNQERLLVLTARSIF